MVWGDSVGSSYLLRKCDPGTISVPPFYRDGKGCKNTRNQYLFPTFSTRYFHVLPLSPALVCATFSHFLLLLSVPHTRVVISHRGMKTLRQCAGKYVLLLRWSPSECQFCVCEPGMDNMTPVGNPRRAKGWQSLQCSQEEQAFFACNVPQWASRQSLPNM